MSDGHTFGGHALDRYVFDFETDLGAGGAEDVGGGHADELAAARAFAAPAAEREDLADDVRAALDDTPATPAEEAGGGEWAPSEAEWREMQQLNAELRQHITEYAQRETQGQVQAALGELLADPLADDFPERLQLAVEMMASGDPVRWAEAQLAPESAASTTGSPELDTMLAREAPDLPTAAVVELAEQLVDDVAESTGLAGQALVEAAVREAAAQLRAVAPAAGHDDLNVLRFESELEAREEARETAAKADAQRLITETIARVDPRLTPTAVQARTREIAQVLAERRANADPGFVFNRAFAAEVVEEAARDLAEPDSEDDVLRRVFRRQQLGLPPVQAPAKPESPSSAEASQARVDARRLERLAEETLAQENLAQLRPGDADDELEAARIFAARARGAA
jgi:hypothetical protein